MRRGVVSTCCSTGDVVCRGLNSGLSIKRDSLSRSKEPSIMEALAEKLQNQETRACIVVAFVW